jgi:hypothetical protein
MRRISRSREANTKSATSNKPLVIKEKFLPLTRPSRIVMNRGSLIRDTKKPGSEPPRLPFTVTVQKEVDSESFGKT